MNNIIAPSILSADFIKIEQEILSIEKSGAQWVHLDIMDGRFVPNITFGPFIIKQLRKLTKLPFDAHLMIEEPSRFVESFAKAGCNMITVHAETDRHLHRTLDYIRSFGLKAGVALNPTTPLSVIESISDSIDILLLMTVNPGFGGQSFISQMTQKIEKAAQMKKEGRAHWTISLDGGINYDNARELFEKGADAAVMGSAFFSRKSDNERAELISHVLSH